MAKMKWGGVSGKGVAPQAGMNYAGPDLPKGSYPAKIKRMEVVKIASNSPNKGKPRIRILLEVQTSHIKGKEQYHGAPVWDGLNIIDNTSAKGFVNAFLHALTDGSERAKRTVEAVFWDEDKGCDFKRIRNKKTEEVETHITKIGRIAIGSPEGTKMVQIVTRPGEDNKGRYRPEVAEYISYKSDGSELPKDDEDSEDEDDMLGETYDVDDEDEDDDDDTDEDEEDYGDDDDDDTDEDDGDETDEDDGEPVKGKRERPF